ncbi:hypothetical protein GZ77_03845 [Endozoicomonas montiporae]|uniref:Capsid protein n=2 Tax=Endozoicomonas montiporae TaxID=1027273 RepID=A0A081NB87_9GAMM|nr:phage major capsid protein, P2 family [Endozoicomonas montiporae]AMO56565.1 P2 family phage major capsid protein [Endozoicomonas montiporae CL-33]KEQ15710.1 hypothetical protein GZ77_03845 [Endozoicomonas montiporae]
MLERTVKQFAMLQQAMAKAYGVTDVTRRFNVSIPMEISLNQAVLDSNDFLNRITTLPKVDKVGKPSRVRISSTLASRTDTSDGTKQRKPTKMKAPEGIEYRLEQTNFDVAFDYETLDSWARFDNFMELYMNAVYQRIGLDRILIGFNGSSAEKNTDRETNPLLQDVNKGWLHLLETHHPENFMTESQEDSGQITLGAAGDFKNLDHLVYSVGSMIGDASKSGDEVAIVGRGLIAHDSGKALAKFAQQPTEKSNIMVLEKSYGGYPSIVVPGFPANGVMVTDLDNLHLYYQEGRMRRKSEDQSASDQVVDFISSNEAYMLEDFDAAAAIDAANVVIKDEEATPA